MLCFKNVDRKLFNIIYLGICFMILFTSEFAAFNMQKILISSIEDEKENFKVDGYTINGLVYTVYSVSLWLAPAVISLAGLRMAMVYSATGFMLYLLAYAVEEMWVIYLAAMLCGMCSAVIWTAEGRYLISNSEPKTITRNVGVFWLLFSSAQFYGNIFTYSQLEGKQFLDRQTRRKIVYVLSGIAGTSILSFMFLRPIKKEIPLPRDKPVEALKKTWSVFTSRTMVFLSIAFCYTGLQQAFATGVYSSTIGFTMQFGKHSKELVALSGIFMGIGEIVGGVFQIMVGASLSRLKYGRSIIFVLGVISELISYSLTYINLPNSAVFGNTDDKAIIENSAMIAMIGSFLLGLSDSFFNTQNYSIIAATFPTKSAQACALYKFIKCVSVSVGFYSTSHLGLHTQLMILAPAAITGASAYCTIDRKVTNIKWNIYNIQKASKKIENARQTDSRNSSSGTWL
ncbi:UNC93-like protein MFSD11 [Lycorma delicatula]|uniref:UNC93-like protein MFSD11 n=1 Tax=Lycorma delicatula TaxID=130591 RepID=UPI003F516315